MILTYYIITYVLTWVFLTIRGPNMNSYRRALIIRAPTETTLQFIETAACIPCPKALEQHVQVQMGHYDS